MYNYTNGHASALNAANFALNGNAVPADGNFHEIGRYQVPEGIGVGLGSGVHAAQDTATGRVYMNLQNATPANIDGVIRIEVHNPQDRSQFVAFEQRTDQLRTSESDRRQQIPFPTLQQSLIGPYWYFVMYFKADAASTPAAADTVLLMSATEFDAAP